MQETQVLFLGWEDFLEKEGATHSSIPTWEIPWTEEPGGLHSVGLQELDMTEVTEHTHTHTHTQPICFSLAGYSFPCQQPLVRAPLAASLHSSLKFPLP